MIKTEISKQERALVKQIHQLIEVDAECEVLIKEMFLNVYIESTGNEAEVMLRFNEHIGKIVIARIYLMKQRQGGLTKIIQLLEEYISVHPNYHTVEIESVLTPEMQQYCLKHGFEVVKSVPFNYQKSIK